MDQKKAIELGKQLAAEFSQHGRDDQAIRWMAFYLGEQITRAETATGADKASAEKACFDTILSLWEHRDRFPAQVRLFKEFEGIAATLIRIHPEHPKPYYYKVPLSAKMGTDDVSTLLRIAEATDSIARSLISAALGEAVDRATDPAVKSFLETEIGEDRTDITEVLNLIRAGTDLNTGYTDDRISKLLAQISIFSRQVAVLKRMLKAKQAAKTASPGGHAKASVSQ